MRGSDVGAAAKHARGKGDIAGQTNSGGGEWYDAGGVDDGPAVGGRSSCGEADLGGSTPDGTGQTNSADHFDAWLT